MPSSSIAFAWSCSIRATWRARATLVAVGGVGEFTQLVLVDTHLLPEDMDGLVASSRPVSARSRAWAAVPRAVAIRSWAYAAATATASAMPALPLATPCR